jgi:hypothetical protein
MHKPGQSIFSICFNQKIHTNRSNVLLFGVSDENNDRLVVATVVSWNNLLELENK